MSQAFLYLLLAYLIGMLVGYALGYRRGWYKGMDQAYFTVRTKSKSKALDEHFRS